MTGRPFWTANASHPARPPKHQPSGPPGAAATCLCPCGALLKATATGQTDRRCPCCTEEEEGELKHHSHLDLKNRPQARIVPVDLGALPSGSWGLCAASAPPQGHPGAPDGQGHPQGVTALAWALHGTEQLCILPSTVWSGIMCVICLVLARFHPKGLPQEISAPGSAWVWGEGWLQGQGEQAGAVQAPCTGNCHSTSPGCCLQFSHTARQDVGGMLLLKAWELCRFQPG